MTHENAPESTESDAGPESGPVSDGEAQDAREARYAEAILLASVERHMRDEEETTREVAFESIRSSGVFSSYVRSARAAIEVAEAELAPLRAHVAELEAERDASVNAHARAIVQLSEWMERAEGAEADLVNAWLAVEEVADEVDRGGSLADYIRSLAAAGPAVSDGEGATSEVAILSGVVLSAAGGIAATAAAASEQANVAKSLAAECQPRPQSDYDRARHAVAELRTKAGFVLGDVIATLVLDSGVVVPPSPVVAPSATDETTPVIRAHVEYRDGSRSETERWVPAGNGSGEFIPLDGDCICHQMPESEDANGDRMVVDL